MQRTQGFSLGVAEKEKTTVVGAIRLYTAVNVNPDVGTGNDGCIFKKAALGLVSTTTGSAFRTIVTWVRVLNSYSVALAAM